MLRSSFGSIRFECFCRTLDSPSPRLTCTDWLVPVAPPVPQQSGFSALPSPRDTCRLRQRRVARQQYLHTAFGTFLHAWLGWPRSLARPHKLAGRGDSRGALSVPAPPIPLRLALVEGSSRDPSGCTSRSPSACDPMAPPHGVLWTLAQTHYNSPRTISMDERTPRPWLRPRPEP